MRYLEVATFGQSISTPCSILSDYNTLNIGIVADRELIYAKINKRVDIMLNMGLENEVKGLLDEGLSLDNNCMNTIGYREMAQYLKGEIDYDTCVELIKQYTRNYCKRQLTFMKTIPELKLLEINEARKTIEEFLNDNTK
jgi:tRNA dimethylallyltransferase